MSVKHDSKGSLIAALWRVYAILFEYAFQTHYKFQVLRVAEDAGQLEAKLRREFGAALAAEEKANADSLQQIQKLQDRMKQQEQELKLKDDMIKGLERSLVANLATQEREVSLRTRFEERINQLHSLNRTTREEAEAYASRLHVKEEELKKMLESKLQVQEQLSVANVAAETHRRAMLLAEEKLNFKQQDLDAKTKVINDIQKRLAFLIMENTKHGTQLLTYKE